MYDSYVTKSFRTNGTAISILLLYLLHLFWGYKLISTYLNDDATWLTFNMPNGFCMCSQAISHGQKDGILDVNKEGNTSNIMKHLQTKS